MTQQSIIEHKANMYYVEFREDYLAICLACTYKKPMKDDKKSKASPYCKALILAIMEHWTNDKRGKGESLYVFMSYAQWIEAMYSMFGRTVVIDSIDELLGEELISREPYKMFGRDTFKYLLNTKLVNERMKALPDRDPHITRPLVNGSDMGHQSTSNLDPFKSKRVTRPLVNGTQLLVNDDPSTSNHNIYSYTESTQIPNIDSTEQDSVTPNIETPQDETNVSTHTHLSSEKKSSQDEEPPKEKSPTRKKPAAKKETVPQITLTPDEQTIYDFYCHLWFVEIPPKITEDLKSHCAKLHHSVKSQEDMDNLEKFARANNRFKNKVLYLGNLVNAVNGWRQMQPQQQPKPTTAPAPTAVFLDEQKASQLANEIIVSARGKGHEIQARAIATGENAFGIEVQWNTPYVEEIVLLKSEKRLRSMYSGICQIWENSKAKVK